LLYVSDTHSPDIFGESLLGRLFIHQIIKEIEVAENVVGHVVCPPQKIGVTLRSRAAIDVWKAVNASTPRIAKQKAIPPKRHCLQCGNAPVLQKFCSPACRQAAYRERETQYRETSAAYANLKEKQKSARTVAGVERNNKFASENRHRAIGFDGRYTGVDYEFAPKRVDVKVPTAAHLINDGLKPLWKNRKAQE
jgi:predicted nucleic acid-binding Zn ribbon protein